MRYVCFRTLRFMGPQKIVLLHKKIVFFRKQCIGQLICFEETRRWPYRIKIKNFFLLTFLIPRPQAKHVLNNY